MRLQYFLFLVVAVFASEASAADGMGPGDIISSFRQYELLNDDLVLSSGCECTAAQLREKMEKYSEGPLEHALDSAVQIICSSENTQLLHALFHVTLATSDSGSESPAWSLGRAFACQPEFVANEFKSLQRPQQRSLYEMLNLGFENAVYEHPEAQEVVELRARLHSLAPAAEK